MDSEITQPQLMLMIFQLVAKSGVCPDNTPSELLRTLVFMHTKGYLYCAFENDKLAVVAGMYRIKEINDEVTETPPEKEEGDILYVSFLSSFADDKLLAKRILTKYLQDNPDIKEIAFYERNSEDDLRRYKRTGVKEYEKAEIQSAVSPDAVAVH